MCRLTVLPSSSKYLRLQRTPSGPPAKAKHLQMEAAGSCQENVGPCGPRGQEPRKQEGWWEAAPPTHTLHSQRTLRLKGSVRGRHGASSDLEESGASGVPRHSAKQTSDLSIRKRPLSPRVCGAPSMRFDPAWRELSLARGTPAERCTHRGRESGPGRARRARRWQTHVSRAAPRSRCRFSPLALQGPCVPLPGTRGPTFPEICSPYLCGVHGARKRPYVLPEIALGVGVRMGETLVSCFQVPSSSAPPPPCPARGGAGK